MKNLFSMLICVFSALLCTSCEKYENLDVKYYDVYGTWKLISYQSGMYGGPEYTGIDHLTILKSDEKKLTGRFPNKLSKFADYKTHFKGVLVAFGEVFIINQYDDVVWVCFTNNPFHGSNQIAIESVDTNEMILNMSYPEYSGQRYSFVRVSNTIK